MKIALGILLSLTLVSAHAGGINAVPAIIAARNVAESVPDKALIQTPVAPPHYRGFLIRTQEGKIKKVEMGLMALETCKYPTCEPDYVQSVQLSKKKKKDVPTPSPTPSPTPLPTVDPIVPFVPPAGETVDYSKAILNAQEAWSITQGSPSVIVAVIDSGAQMDHPDLKDNLVPGFNFITGTPGAEDDFGHGTHCAGIIAAESNGIGTIGLAPKVKVMPLKFLSKDGWGMTSDAITAINYAVDHGVKIISNSWGAGIQSQFLCDTIKAATDKGVLFVAAAGNAGTNNDEVAFFPSNCPGTLSVAATGESDHIAAYSDFSSKSVWISAPGSLIYSTIPASTWGFKSGTSMATPQVSAALALGWSKKPTATAAELKDKLCKTAKKILLDKTVCGRMDVAAFLKSL